MTGKEHQRPGEWPDISRRADYHRLVALARRRLVGFEQHAEDVVTLAVIKWRRLSATTRGARLEQVVKTEAYSFVRSLLRATARDTRVVGDRSSALAGDARPHSETELAELRAILAATIQEADDLTIEASDIEVLELLFTGLSLSDVVRRTGLTRQQVKSSRATWRIVLQRAGLEPTPDRSSARP